MKKRRNFLLTSLTAACAAIFAPARAKDAACAPTESDWEGPLYISGMPVMRGNINRFGQVGEEVEVSGFVRSAAGGFAPIAGARLEVWHADGAGKYHPGKSGDRADFDDSELDLRGAILTDKDGRYAYRTVVPGTEKVLLFFSRPPHIHYRIQADGFSPLTTQHYISIKGELPGGPCRSAKVERAGEFSRFRASDIYLDPV